MFNIAEQVLAGLLIIVINAALTPLMYLARSQIKLFIIWLKRQWQYPFVLLTIPLLLEVVSYFSPSLFGISILLHLILLGLVWILFRNQYSPKPLRIISATWGKDRAISDVTNTLHSMVQNGKISAFTVGMSIFVGNDPCKGIAKELNVVYVVRQSKVVPENEQFSLP